jgi:excisionase family DNA binding protein
MSDRYLTQAEVCSRLRISPKTLQQYRKQGRIPFRNFGHRSIRIRESEVAMFEACSGTQVMGSNGISSLPSETLKPRTQSSDSILVELVPEDELPIDCAAPLERCAATAAVWVTSSSGYQRRPMCLWHAHVVFAEWCVGI